jgi:hypothetical protein
MRTRRSADPQSLMPSERNLPALVEAPAEMRDWAEELVARARAEGLDLTCENGLLTSMVRQVLQTGLEVSWLTIWATNPTTRLAAVRGTAATAPIRRRSRPRSATSRSRCLAIATGRSSR